METGVFWHSSLNTDSFCGICHDDGLEQVDYRQAAVPGDVALAASNFMGRGSGAGLSSTNLYFGSSGEAQLFVIMTHLFFEAAVPDAHLVPAVRRLLLSMLCRLRCLWRLRRLRPVGTNEATATAGTASDGQP
jgi:hypothetical protein